MEKKINFGKLLSIFLVLIMLSSFVLAYGVVVGAPVGRPLQVFPGESGETYIKIQNTGPDVENDITVDVSLLDDGGVASINQNRIEVKAGEQVEVPVIVNVPADAAIGTEYLIRYKIDPVPSAEGVEGTITFGIGYEGELSALVVEKPAEPEPVVEEEILQQTAKTSMWVWIGLIVLIIIIVLLIVKTIKKKSRLGNLPDAPNV